jgi:hypothetical protein
MKQALGKKLLILYELSLFQNPVGFESGSWRKLPISCCAKNYAKAIFSRGKKLFQKLKFWNSLS